MPKAIEHEAADDGSEHAAKVRNMRLEQILPMPGPCAPTIAPDREHAVAVRHF
jgi:hypothetical protein